MKMPGFTAEASLGEIKDSYALALGHAEESGTVLPQSVCCRYFGNVWSCFPCGPVQT
jgi:hypothetical protein